MSQTIIWGVGIAAGIVGIVFIGCFIQAALEKMNLITGACNNVGWPQPGRNDIGILSLIPQLREYPPGYPVPPPGQPPYWYLFPNNAQGNSTAAAFPAVLPPAQQAPVTAPVTPQVHPIPSRDRPTIMYHGTPKREWGMIIFSKNKWKIGPSLRLFLSDDFDLAAMYARRGSDGVVVKLHVPLNVKLEQKGPKIYSVVVPNPIQRKPYYRIKGIKPVALLDVNGNQIKP